MLLLVVVVAAFRPAAKVEEVSSAVFEELLSFDFAWQNRNIHKDLKSFLLTENLMLTCCGCPVAACLRCGFGLWLIYSISI